MAHIGEKKVSEIMHKGVETIPSSATITEALRRMAKAGVSSLVVSPRNAGDAYGIITKWDIVTKIIAPGPKRRNFSQVKVYELMSKPLVVVSPGLKVKYAARLIAKTRCSRLPVFDGKELVGVLSFSDIFNEAMKQVR